MRKLTINGTNIAEYAIVLKAIPAPAEVTAAEFLQKVIKTSCGVKLPITATAENGIFIGTREADPRVKWDGFRMTTDDRNVYLDGNIPRGTLYAVYDFSEKYLGYRMFADDCEVIPTEGEADVPCGLDVVDNPGFESRRSDPRSRLDSGVLSSHDRLNDAMPCGEELGGTLGLGGDCHSFPSLCPPDLYFDEHPEYYSLYNGERVPCGDAMGQLCLTNPDVIRIVTENVLSDLRANPGKKLVEVSHADGGVFCQCDNCRALFEQEGSQAGPLLYFVNAIAEAVEKEFPDVMVRTFAYEDTRIPPKHMKARDNVVIRYCTYDSCFRHGLEDPNCELNSTTTKLEMEGWREHCSKMSIWDYITNWDCFIAPFPNLISLFENVKYFLKCGVIHVFTETNLYNSTGGVYNELKDYLVGKLLWKPTMDWDEYKTHIKEFLVAFYGPGWREIAEYIRMEYEATEGRCFTCKEAVDIAFLHFDTYPKTPLFKRMWRRNYIPQPFQPAYPNHPLTKICEQMETVKGLFARALAAAENDVQRFHIERSAFSIKYLELFCTDRVEWTLSPEEHKAYMAEVEQFYKDKEKFNFYYNNHTAARKR